MRNWLYGLCLTTMIFVCNESKAFLGKEDIEETKELKSPQSIGGTNRHKIRNLHKLFTNFKDLNDEEKKALIQKYRDRIKRLQKVHCGDSVQRKTDIFSKNKEGSSDETYFKNDQRLKFILKIVEDYDKVDPAPLSNRNDSEGGPQTHT